MLCIARVALPSQALDEVKDVDPSDEQVQGLLKAGFLVPLVKRPAEAAAPAPSIIEFKVQEPDSKPRARRKPVE